MKKTRYRILKYVSKVLTPTLYRNILKKIIMDVLNPFTIKDKACFRPAINKIMKDYSLFKEGRLVGAEIGVQYGLNALNILNTLQIKGLYLIDNWENEGEYNYNQKEPFRNVKRLFENDIRITIIKHYSREAVRQIPLNHLDFVYIDANHDYNHVLEDLTLWTKRVKTNGIVAGHDIQREGVYEALKTYCGAGGIEFKIIPPDWYFYKIGRDWEGLN